MEEMNLNGGVLIIGSLWWQDHGRRPGDNRRKNWRQDYLDTKESIRVLAPFRYGRQSSDGVYTMTFSNSARRKPGTGIVAPFLSNPLKELAAIRREAVALSTAEGMGGRFIKAAPEGDPWAALGIVCNPKKVKAEQRKKLMDWWSDQLQAEEAFVRFDTGHFRLGKEKPCVLPNGQLNFPWPAGATAREAEQLQEYHFLLATATLPTGDKYPTLAQMKKNVESDTERRYFQHNYENGIRTFQDERIRGKA